MKMLGFKLVMLLLVGVVAMPMLIPGPDGEPIMTPGDWIPSDTIGALLNFGDHVVDAVEAGVEQSDPAVIGAGAQIYSWRDERGVIHYSDTPVEGAEPIVVPHDGLAIPAQRFVQSGLAPAAPPASGSRARSTLLLERDPLDRSRPADNGKPAPGLAELEALRQGDLSNAATVLENLPELLEQARAVREASSSH